MLGIKVLNNTCFVCVFAIYSNVRCDSSWINLFRRSDLKSWLQESICNKYWFSSAFCSLQMDKRWRLNLRNAAVVLLSCGAVNRCSVSGGRIDRSVWTQVLLLLRMQNGLPVGLASWKRPNWVSFLNWVSFFVFLTKNRLSVNSWPWSLLDAGRWTIALRIHSCTTTAD